MKFYWTFDSLSLKNKFTWNGYTGSRSADNRTNTKSREDIARVMRLNREYHGKNKIQPLLAGRSWLFHGYMNGPGRTVLYWVEP